MIDPVAVCYLPEARQRGIQPDELKKLTDYFREALVEAVADAYPVVADPGPEVLRLRVAITDVAPSDVALNLIATALVYVPVDMGSASMEAELLDSLTGARLAAVVDSRTGSQLDILGGYTRWSHAKIAFDGWAAELRAALDEVHGR